MSTCPFCAAPITPRWGTEGILRFTCGSMLHDSAPSRRHQTARCVETEVGKLEDRIASIESSARALLDVIDGDAEDITEAVDALRGAVEAKP